jgi:pyruvate dehydrogenase (quinone)
MTATGLRDLASQFEASPEATIRRFIEIRKEPVAALMPMISVKTDTAHLDRMTAHYHRSRARLDKLARDRRNDSPLHPQFVAATIDRLAAPDAVFTADVGTSCIWAARYLKMNGTRRLIGSFNHGSMANALPHAIGAQASHPGRQVISLSGDGGLALLFDFGEAGLELP